MRLSFAAWFAALCLLPWGASAAADRGVRLVQASIPMPDERSVVGHLVHARAASAG